VSTAVFKAYLMLAALLFTIIFCLLAIPALIERPNIIEAFAAGFVNPFVAGYSTDVIFLLVRASGLDLISSL
jgi:hypothetical protein